MGEWDWEGKRCSVNKVQGDGRGRGRKGEQRFVCICQLKKNSYPEQSFGPGESDHSLCSEATVTSSVPTHPFLHRKVAKAEFENEEIKIRKSFAVLGK